MSHHDSLDGPLEQPEPRVGGNQDGQILFERGVLARREVVERRHRHLDQWEPGPGIEASHRHDQVPGLLEHAGIGPAR